MRRPSVFLVLSIPCPGFAFFLSEVQLPAPVTTPGRSGPPAKPSLRTELLINIAVLAAGALVLAVASALLAPLFGSDWLGAVALAGLVVADLLIFIAFGRYLVTRLVTRPIDALVGVTEAVALGEMGRRAPEAKSRELDQLATSVNRMADRLLDAQGALIRAEKLASVGRLAAGIAHEVGNPLSAINNYMEVLRRRGADPEVVTAIERESGRIDQIVRSLLAYARPGATNREPLDPAVVARGAVDLLRSQGVLRGVDVQVTVDDQVPLVNGDRTGLEQVLVNLLLNAVDAAGAGGRIAVSVSPTLLGAGIEEPRRVTDPSAHAPGDRNSRRHGRHLAGFADGTRAAQVLVADNGPGVAAELLGRIFDPFFTTKGVGEGTGLGLSVVRQVVGRHGGHVTVQSSPGNGARFTVTLPSAGARLGVAHAHG
jgi:signal transduction histidine kinase